MFNPEYFFNQIYTFFAGEGALGIAAFVATYFSLLLELSRPFLIFFSLLCLTGLMYCSIRIKQIRAEEAAKLTLPKSEAVSEKYINKKWAKVEEHINSQNPSEWRLAIIESDILLEEMMDQIGYRGETLGEKLKSVEKSDFTTIDKAWEAHSIRNAIAHEGSDFLLTEREARRVISLFKDVFEEFHFI